MARGGRGYKIPTKKLYRKNKTLDIKQKMKTKENYDNFVFKVTLSFFHSLFLTLRFSSTA